MIVPGLKLGKKYVNPFESHSKASLPQECLNPDLQPWLPGRVLALLTTPKTGSVAGADGWQSSKAGDIGDFEH